MKPTLLMAGLLALLTFSCHLSEGPQSTFKPEQLPLQSFSITIDKDTTLVTAGGALIKIPKGSLSSGSSRTVDLEIREALSIQQIIRAGLLTASGLDPLSSGGMININAKAGQDVKIEKQLSVALPTKSIDEKMQLYRGEPGKEGNIDWIDPKPLKASKQAAALDTGRLLYQQFCGNCHGIGKDGTGPDLAHWLKWLPPEQKELRGYHLHYPWVFKSDSQNERTIDTLPQLDESSMQVDLYSCNMRKIFGSVGTAINLSRHDLDAIYHFIENESDKKDLPIPYYAQLDEKVDSCIAYLRTLQDLLQQRSNTVSGRQRLIENNGLLVNKIPDPTWGLSNTLPPDFDLRVSPRNYQSVYYQFTIETFGWFNVDALVKNFDGVKDSELFVRIRGAIREKVQVYLIIPSMKVYGEGGPADRDREEFAFYYRSGHLPLPMGRKAYILALSESDTSIAFGLQSFTTTTKQELEISLTKSTKELFAKAIDGLSLDRMSVTVDDSKNADLIRNADAQIRNIEDKIKAAEKLRPQNCDCNCGPAKQKFTAGFSK